MLKISRQTNSFLKPGRVSDLSRLIFILGLSGMPSMSIEEFQGIVTSSPDSDVGWLRLIEHYPEYFLIENNTGSKRVSLLARNTGFELSLEDLLSIQESISRQHQVQVQQDQKFGYWMPVTVAVIIALGNILASALKLI